jgi:hypothetical protein
VPVPATGLLSREALADGDIAKRYCLDKAFVSAATARAGRRGPSTAVAEFVRYVMVTPDVQPPPIGRFYLTVDKGRSDTLVSMCASNVAKTGETAVRVERFDFVPDRDIDIVFVRGLDTQ